MEEIKQANTDTTYCINEKCKDKCWRHTSNWKFDKQKSYWITNTCEEFIQKEALWKNL